MVPAQRPPPPSARSTRNGVLTITALGDQVVPDNAYSGPAATTAPFNAKTITRHYGFGDTNAPLRLPPALACNTLSSVTIGGATATITSLVGRSDPGDRAGQRADVHPAAAGASIGGSAAQCGELVITAGNGKQSIDAVTVTVGGKAPTHVNRLGHVPHHPGRHRRGRSRAT